MINHIVLFQWKPEATDTQTAALLGEMRGLQERIPGIVSLTCGTDFTGRAQGYTHALFIQFTDRAALDAYGPHPAHQALIEQMKPILAQVLDFDFEAA